MAKAHRIMTSPSRQARSGGRASLATGAARMLGLAAMVALAGCQAIPRAEPPRAQTPAPAPAPGPVAPPPAPLPPPAQDLSWEQAPATPGDWHYRQGGAGSVATFGSDPSAPRLSFTCNSAAREIVIAMAGAVGGARTLVVRTSGGDLQWATRGGDRVEVRRPAGDPGFDWIAYSRGRIAVEVPGVTRLIVPQWPEIGRVIEDCRG